MLTLGIETSCDETSFSVVRNGREVLSNVVLSSLKEHRPFGGVVPEIASRSHVEGLTQTLKLSLKKSRIDLKQIDLIAVTRGPGLMGSLLVGLSAAKALAYCLNKPIVGVDHVLAHLYAGIAQEKKPTFPYLGLAVSGGHTLLVRIDSVNRFKVVGRTIDDAAGEAFDKVAKMLGLGYPGGPVIDRISQSVRESKFYFTRPFLSKDSLDFSFSGIKTAVFYEIEKLKKNHARLSALEKAEICHAFQECVCEVLVHKTRLAAKTLKVRRLVVGGGVSLNTSLRLKINQMVQAESLSVRFMSPDLCQDNAAMIAMMGTALFKSGHEGALNMDAYADFMQHHGEKGKLEELRWKSDRKNTKIT